MSDLSKKKTGTRTSSVYYWIKRKNKEKIKLEYQCDYQHLTLFPESGHNYVNLRGADSAPPPPRDLENYWANCDAKNTIRRAVTLTF